MPGRRPLPSGSSSIPGSRTRSVRSTKARGHGLDGAGAGARHHDHVRRDDLFLARHPDQHHRHAGSRRLHGRSRALAARPRRRVRRVRRRVRCRAAVRDRVASGRQVPRAAHLLRQQDGPHRRRLQDDARADRDQAGRQPGGDSAADRRGGQVRRRDRPREDEGDHLQGRDDGRRLRSCRRFRPTCWPRRRSTARS